LIIWLFSIDKFPFLKKGDYLLVPAEPCSFSLPHILTSKHKTAANGIFPIPDPAKVTCSFVSTEIRSEDP